MDRGRAGGYVGNNYVQVQLNKKKRQQHLDRIQKIKGRKPGSSATLDNNPPMVIEAMLNDPRKTALRDQYNFVTERENKVLLKRISAILTAPPKITDKEYQEMKRLVVPSTKGFRKVYENGVTMQKNKEFFVHLKTLQPFYKAKEWESDYQKQLFNQRFMRQVKYKRPPGFVDPLVAVSDSSTSTENKAHTAEGSPSAASPVAGIPRHDRKSASMITHGGGQGGASLASLGGGKSSSSHVGRVRAVRHDNVNKSASFGKSESGSFGHGRSSSGRGARRDTNSPSGRHRGSDDNHSAGGDDENDEYGYDGFDDQDDEHSHPGSSGTGGIRMNVYEGGDGDYDHDSFYREGEDGFGDGNSGSDENRVQLAVSHRPIRITDENTSDSLHNTDLMGSNQHAEADIQCWLINQEYVVISAATLDKGRSLDAEAEISVADLSVIRGLPPDQSLLTDIPAMEAIAREMVENVELRVDGGVSRLVLNLVSDGDDEDAEYQLSDNEGGMAGAGGSGSQALQAGSMSLVSEEEIEAMLLADRNQTVLIKGSRIPVAFNVNANAQSIGSITALIELAKRAKRIEFVYVLLKLSSTSDDQMSVVAHFMSNTTFMFKRGSKHRPAVTAGSFVVTTTSLPSVIQADPDMLLTFAENLSLNLKVEHDCKTGENELIIVGI